MTEQSPKSRIDPDSITIHRQSNLYTFSTLAMALLIIAALIYLGFKGYSFWLVVLVGGLVQVVFRVLKRAWSNALNSETDEPDQIEEQASIGNGLALGAYLGLYAAMVLVSALWYGIGSVFNTESFSSLLWKWPLELLGLM